MRAKYREATTTTRPVASAMDLNAGGLRAGEAIALFGVSCAMLVVGTVGWSVFWLASHGDGVWLFWSILGGAIGTLGLAMAMIVFWLAVRSWYAHHQRMRDWHEAALDAQERANGQETTRTTREWDLSRDSFRDILLIAIATHWQVQRGVPTPWSVRGVVGDTWIGNMRVGDVPPASARQIADRLGEIGLVIGRSERRAGQWVPRSFDDVVGAVANGWRF